MLFQVISGPTVAVAKEEMEKGKAFADGYEFRIDQFNDKKGLKDLIAQSNLPVLITVRKKSQGGFFAKEEKERKRLLESLLEIEPEYVDIEADTPFLEELAEKYFKTEFILSHHDFEKIPENLEQLFSSLQRIPRGIVKMACFANSSLDALRMMRFVREKASHGQKIIGISMGEKGQFSRALGPVMGNFIDYAPLKTKGQTAPGQYTLQQLCEIFRYKSLNHQSCIYALIGSPVTQSLSHITHNEIFEEMGKNAVYVKIDMDTHETPAFFSLIHDLPFHGFSITMPLKETVQPFIQLDPKAKKIGAVNTLKENGDEWIGFNTDCVGAMNAIETKMKVENKKIVLLGAGGAAKAIAYEAMLRKGKVIILNRSEEKAKELAASLGCEGYGLSKIEELKGYDVLINATSVGMDSDEIPIQPDQIDPKALVMEIITHPPKTKLLREAEKKGCEIIKGIEMWIFQAIEQYVHWFGKKIDPVKVEDKIRHILKCL